MKKLTLIAALPLMALWSSCSHTQAEKKETEKYQVTNAFVTDTSVTREYVAQIQSVQNIEIRAKIDGYIESILVDEGQEVKAGQVLFTIRPTEFQAELAKAKAEVSAADIEFRNAKTLASRNIVSSNEVALAEAKLAQAKSEEARAALYLSYTTITAPFAGTIDRIRFKTGSLVDEGSLLTSLSDNRNIYAYFNLSEPEYLDYRASAGNNKKEEVGLILANGTPHAHKGRIETIEGQFDNSTGTIALRAKFPNPELLLRNGETGKVQLTTALNKVMMIPQKATFELQDKVYVICIDNKNIAHSKPIHILQRLNGIYIVDEGIDSKDRILLEGIQYVKDDDHVTSEFVQPDVAIRQPVRS